MDFRQLNTQFENLNWNEPGTWPAGPRWLLAALVFVMVLLAAWYFVIDDQLIALKEAQVQEEKLRNDYTERLKKSVNLAALKAQKIQVTAQVAELEKQLPDKAEMDKLLSDINFAGVSKGLQFELFKPGAVKVENYYAELPIDIKLNGSFHKLAGFAADVSALSRIVTLNNINLTVQNNPTVATGNNNNAALAASTLVLDATAKTFRYLDKEEANLVAKKRAESAKK